MAMIKIIIPNHIPESTNKDHAGRHWSKRKEATDKARLLTRAAIDPDKAEILPYCAIRMTAYYNKKPRGGKLIDPGNVNTKPYIDALIGFYFEDDSYEYVDTVTTAVRLDTSLPEPYTEITITPIEL